MLATIAGNNQKEWDLYLQQMLLAYWTNNNELTGATPFLLLSERTEITSGYVFDPPPDHDQSVITYGEYTRQLKERLDTSCQVARKKLKLAQKRQADEYDWKAWGSPYSQGDSVAA